MSKRFRRRGRKSLKCQVASNKAKISKIAGIIERKNVFSSVANGEANTTGVITNISNINQATSANGREGDQVRVRTITVRGIIANDHGTPQDCVVRILVWKNLNPNGVTETITNNVLESVDVLSVRDWDHKDRIKVYYDQMFVMDTSQHTLIPFKIHISGLKAKTTYEGSGAGEADNMMNHYYIGILSDVAGTTNNPQIDFNFRLTFEDA